MRITEIDYSFFVWFYILLPSYRRRLHRQWRFEKWYYVLFDILKGIAQLVFSIVLIRIVLQELIGWTF